MIRETLSAARDLGRLHEISMVLIRWGFGDVVRRIGLSHTLEKAGRALNWTDVKMLADSEPPERVCRALQELGPTFVKLGQMLGSRVDMFSPEWISAFEQLQDQVKGVSWEELLPQLEEDLGAAPDTIFDNIGTVPFAAASIAQVHRAQLKTGEKVVLKIRRPGIEHKIEADLRLLRRIAEIAENSTPELKRFRPTEIVRQFALS
ncbi:MAG: AarF/UbiB family protein, partial [Gammaproteobacteria bacterium]|nr:AarF/UbiB family protein [Gammaproteobacteria bacterium]